jgi:exopolysaccharide biosynthesis polyprenyl glycosylphosphotransferase
MNNKRKGKTQTGFIAVVGDLFLVNLAFILAYWLRYELEVGGEVAAQFFLGLEAYLPVQLVLSVVLLAVFAASGLYRNRSRPSLVEEGVRVLSATSVGMMTVLAAVYLFRGFGYSRGLFAFTWVLVVAFLWLARLGAYLLRVYRQSRGMGLRRVLVVGAGSMGHMVMHIITTEPGLGYRLVGYVSEDGNSEAGRFPSLGRVEDLSGVVSDHNIDEVIIALPSNSHHKVPDLADHCQEEGLTFKIVPDLYELSLSRVDIDDLRGLPLIGVKESSIYGANLVVKRIFDIITSLLLLVLLLPVGLLVALAIKLDSRGPVLFRQSRLGRNGKQFEALKFRSMKMGSEAERDALSQQNEASWPLFKMRNDPRVTRVGRFLRRTSLDEVPQLWNVLKGDMSLVGPRPPVPSEVEEYHPWQRRRLEAPPGITGLWQVSGRSDLPFDEMVMLDIYYIENWSLVLDFGILLRTIPAVISGRGAY